MGISAYALELALRELIQLPQPRPENLAVIAAGFGEKLWATVVAADLTEKEKQAIQRVLLYPSPQDRVQMAAGFGSGIIDEILSDLKASISAGEIGALIFRHRADILPAVERAYGLLTESPPDPMLRELG